MLKKPNQTRNFNRSVQFSGFFLTVRRLEEYIGFNKTLLRCRSYLISINRQCRFRPFVILQSGRGKIVK